VVNRSVHFSDKYGISLQERLSEIEAIILTFEVCLEPLAVIEGQASRTEDRFQSSNMHIFSSPNRL